MHAQTVPYLTPDEYLEIERKAEYKSEYLNGRMWPLGGTPFGMAGGKPAHSIIAVNTALELGIALNGRCRIYNSDMRLRVSGAGLYTYPDLALVCGKPEYAQGDLLTNPTVIVEVLSHTTEKHDRGMKFDQYRTIPSLQEYVLISQSEPRVEVYGRTPEPFWRYRSISDISGVVRLESVGCEIAMAEIYRDVEFEAS